MKPILLRAALMAAALAGAHAPALAQPRAPFLVVDLESVEPRVDGDVLEVAAATGQFTRFLAAVEAAGYGEELRGGGPFTVFAPTDAAFEDMNQGELERLMRPQNRDELVRILSYHVVEGRVTSENLSSVARTASLAGHRLTIDGRDGLRVNDELVAIQDVEASNGVIQGINAVLSPPVLVADR